MPERLVTTYSFWSAFKNCRKLNWYRYHEQLVPAKEAMPLFFGSAIHKCLEMWHGGNWDLKQCLAYLATESTKLEHEEGLDFMYRSQAMMEGYVKTYPQEDWKVIALEEKFTGDIRNPETGRVSKSFSLSGKVDGLVRRSDGLYWLLEHKTASSINGSYLDRLWCDMQITLYSKYLSEQYQITMSGVIYNILGKPALRRGKNEEWGAFGERLRQRHMEDPECYNRTELVISHEQYNELAEELWELTQAYLGAQKRDKWYRNTDHCFKYNKACPYFTLCKSGDNPVMRENLYRIQERHIELKDEESKPAF